jgi:hypothetical protein
MPAEYTILPIPLSTESAKVNSFSVHIVSALHFPQGTYERNAIRSVLAQHPILRAEKLDGYAMEISTWTKNNFKFERDKSTGLSLVYAGTAGLSSVRATLDAYLTPADKIQASRIAHDDRFDKLTSDHFVDIGHTYDRLGHAVRTLHASAIRALGTDFDPQLAMGSSDALRWVNANVQAALLEALYSKNDALIKNLGTLGLNTDLASLRAAVAKIERRLAVQKKLSMLSTTADEAIRTTSAGGAAEVQPADPNVAIHAALKHPLLAQHCGFATVWTATADKPLIGDFVLFLDGLTFDPKVVSVRSKLTAFHRGVHTHPLSFLDVASRKPTTGALAWLNDEKGQARYRATSVNADGHLVKQLIVQSRNSLAPLGQPDSRQYGQFKDSLDDRSPELLSKNQFGIGEHETVGVTFSAPIQDLATPEKLKAASPEEREKIVPCMFLEDLWIGYRLDLATEGRDEFTSVHTQQQRITFRNGATSTGLLEDYFDREQADDPDQGHSSTDIATYSGFGTAQARDYLTLLGIEPAPLPNVDAPFTKVVTGYGKTERLVFGQTYRYRLRNVFLGGVSVSAKDANLKNLSKDYVQSFPFFRARAFRPGEIVSTRVGEESDPTGGGRTIFLSEERPEKRLTIAPSPIDIDTSRYHGLLFARPDEPARYRHRKHVSDLGKYFVQSSGRMDYFYDPDVAGIVVTVRLLNGNATALDDQFVYANGAYCQLAKHLVLPSVNEKYGTPGRWEDFRPIELVFRTTSNAHPSISSGGFLGRTIEILVPRAGEMEVSILPAVDKEQLAKTASYASSTESLRMTTLDSHIFSSWMPTAAVAEKLIRVIHAVKKPLAKPRLICEGPDRDSIPDANRVYSGFRKQDREIGEVRGRIEISAASTSEVRLETSWQDIRDGESQEHFLTESVSATSKPHSVVFTKLEPRRPAGAVFSTYLSSPSGINVAAQAVRDFRVGQTTYGFHDLFTLQCAENKVWLGPAPANLAAEAATRAGEINFRDSRRKFATVRAVATSRFKKQFQSTQASAYEEVSDSISVDVPSSFLMAAPRISHVLPLRRPARPANAGPRAEQAWYGLRIYVRRPWFESGAGERLAIGCATGNERTQDQASLDKSVTQWGEDPIERPGLVSATRMPRASDFLPIEAASPADQLSPILYPREGERVPVVYRDNVYLSSETDGGVNRRISLASFALRDDLSQRLWYCDVRIAGDFIGWCGLALYRHQPHSLEQREISSASEWVYAAVLHGEPVAWVERNGNLHITVGPIYDRYVSFEFDPLEYRAGISEMVRPDRPKPTPLKKYQIGQATYFEGLVPGSGVSGSLVKRRFGEIVATTGIADIGAF